MNKETLKKLLHEACEILIIYEDSGNAPQEILERIDALFNEIKYSDYLDSEMKDLGPEYDSAGFTEEDRIIDGQYRVILDPDQEAQDWDTFNKNKI